MKKYIAAALLVLTASVASAANLPEKKATPAAPAVTAPESWYVGVNAGGAVKLDRTVTDNPATAGGVVGYKWNPMFATEITVDEQFKKAGQKAQTRVLANGVVSPIGSVFGFTPYALAGVGVQNHDFRDGVRDNNKTIYNVGGGVKYAIAKNWEADARYRYINTWSDGTKIKDDNIITLGLNYKF
jgi:opacity protein-like surface antigen